ncbi:phasin family protein [Pseudomonas sp.]|uniref:phasin family protein n=1 Tax=Pseudomonas sp. TaxID=306 RepID=UPI0019F6749F|nr:phasin family protein [Pseudomonas sp.]MBF0674450.1 phasin family protein [Pseudomonas sp.]
MAGIRKKEGTWSEDVEKYSRQIWLAGLGAYAKIGEDGSALFDALVRDGEQAEQRVRSEVESVKNGALSRVAEARDKALGKWSALEDAFDKRLSGAIARLGVPSRLELKALSSQVEVLSRQLEQMNARALPEPVSEVDEAPIRRRPETRTPAAKAKAAAAPETAQPPATTAKPKTRNAPAKAKPAKQAKPVEQPEQTVQSASVASAAPTVETAPSEQSVNQAE